jgi:hypothetical protein
MPEREAESVLTPIYSLFCDDQEPEVITLSVLNHHKTKNIWVITSVS